MHNVIIVFVMLALLAACGTDSGRSYDSGYQGGKPTGTSRYKVGQPYEVNGIWYYPNEDYSYDETGIASWYGPGFHKKVTANGEIYNQNELTAAHPTLPMPSLARVTNLENGKSIVVRINDRGPFARNRIIDMSKRAAELLDFTGRGTAKVRVQVLADESRAIADAARKYGTKQALAAYASNEKDISLPDVVEDSTSYQQQPSAAPTQPIQTAALEPPTGYQSSAAPLSSSEQYLPAKSEYHKPQPILTRMEAQEDALPVVTRVAVKGNPQIYIQGGAFSDRKNAQRMQSRMAQLGNAQITEANVKGQDFYRVRLGPLASVDVADETLRRVVSSGVSEARIVVD